MPIVSDTAPDVALLGAIRELTNAVNQMNINSPWLNRKEASKYVGIAPNTLDRLVRDGAIKQYKLDDHGIALTRYKKEELDHAYK